MNTNEARLAIIETIADVLFELSDDEDLPAVDREDLRDAMADAADLICEALDLDVVDVADGVLSVQVVLPATDA